METKVLNYRIIIEPDNYPDTGKRCYSAYCPTLGLADYGDTVEKSLSRIKKLVKFHIESLIADNQPVPAPDQEEEFISVAKVKIALPEVKPKDLARAIKKEGFLVKRKSGSHLYFHHPDCRTTSVSVHPKPLPPGTLKAILNQTRISLEKLKKLLS